MPTSGQLWTATENHTITDWCQYCDRLVDRRHMKWDNGHYRCRTCLDEPAPWIDWGKYDPRMRDDSPFRTLVNALQNLAQLPPPGYTQNHENR